MKKLSNFLCKIGYHCQLVTSIGIDGTMRITAGWIHEPIVIITDHCRLCFHCRLKPQNGSEKLITTGSSTSDNDGPIVIACSRVVYGHVNTNDVRIDDDIGSLVYSTTKASCIISSQV